MGVGQRAADSVLLRASRTHHARGRERETSNLGRRVRGSGGWACIRSGHVGDSTSYSRSREEVRTY